MRLITFLGTGNYKETTYEHGDQRVQTELFPVALTEFLKPAEVLAVVTNQAKAMWFGVLEEKLRDRGIPVRAIDIPDGHSVADLWLIFDKLTEHLDEGEEIVFDITHSFRTLPLIVFLAASYLRVAKNIQIGGVYYGAWEARQPPPPEGNPFAASPSDVSPVFDLSPFLTLLEWTSATDQFLKTGIAEVLSRLLKKRHDEIWKGMDVPNKPRGLKPIADTLSQLSRALALPRMREISQQANKLRSNIDRNSREFGTWAKPFHVLLKRTEEDFSRFQRADLATERELVGWYAERGHALQALTLAREWIVSWLGERLGKTDLELREKEIEKVLNQVAGLEKGDSLKEPLSLLIDQVRELEQYEQLHKMWSRIRDLRNDAAHCGYNRQPRTGDVLYNSVVEIVRQLQVFPVSEDSR